MLVEGVGVVLGVEVGGRLVQAIGEDRLLAALAQAVDEVVDGLVELGPLVGGEVVVDDVQVRRRAVLAPVV